MLEALHCEEVEVVESAGAHAHGDAARLRLGLRPLADVHAGRPGRLLKDGHHAFTSVVHWIPIVWKA